MLPFLSITVLGCSGSYASTDNPCSSYLVKSGEATVLLDCGPGSLGNLQKFTTFSDIDAIVITHCHADHWLELPVIRTVFKWYHPRLNASGVPCSVPVYGTAETFAMDKAMLSQSKSHNKSSWVSDPLAWNIINAESDLQIKDQRWRFSATDHSVETLAVRVDATGVDVTSADIANADRANASFAFSSDTGPGWDFRSLGDGIDLAMCDASYTQDDEDKGGRHMSGRQAALAANAAGIKRLVLTHLLPGCDLAAQRAEASAVFAGKVEVAQPLSVFIV